MAPLSPSGSTRSISIPPPCRPGLKVPGRNSVTRTRTKGKSCSAVTFLGCSPKKVETSEASSGELSNSSHELRHYMLEIFPGIIIPEPWRYPCDEFLLASLPLNRSPGQRITGRLGTTARPRLGWPRKKDPNAAQYPAASVAHQKD